MIRKALLTPLLSVNNVNIDLFFLNFPLVMYDHRHDVAYLFHFSSLVRNFEVAND